MNFSELPLQVQELRKATMEHKKAGTFPESCVETVNEMLDQLDDAEDKVGRLQAWCAQQQRIIRSSRFQLRMLKDEQPPEQDEQEEVEDGEAG